MRSEIRHWIRMLSLLPLAVASGTLVLIFQNCAGYSSYSNPLTDTTVASACLGTGCSVDVTTSGFKSSASDIYLSPPSGATPSSADNSSTFDVSGFCEDGGFASTQFIYQWQLAPQGTQAAVSTAAKCDDNGRFQFQVQVPTSLYNYSSAVVNYLHVYMNVIDVNGNIQRNPNSSAFTTYTLHTLPQ